MRKRTILVFAILTLVIFVVLAGCNNPNNSGNDDPNDFGLETPNTELPPATDPANSNELPPATDPADSSNELPPAADPTDSSNDGNWWFNIKNWLAGVTVALCSVLGLILGMTFLAGKTKDTAKTPESTLPVFGEPNKKTDPQTVDDPNMSNQTVRNNQSEFPPSGSNNHE
ncbi:MAG: hypothetical protein FWG40_06240 [Peptococcaceae bacterium]|nr:hypothetical protein [Peptococcaceae bacterium]